MDYKLPLTPEPLEVEIELTNNCNASCAVCPRKYMKRERGYMTEEVHNKILEVYKKEMENYKINSLQKEKMYPYINYAGLGEPLLHPKLFSFIQSAKKMGFKTLLITNASLLTEEKREELLKSELDCLHISFWGIKKEEYEYLMHLDYERTLKNITETVKVLKNTSTKVRILWVQLPKITSTVEEIKTFWDNIGVEVDTEDLKPWNKGGYVKEHDVMGVFDKLPGTDYSKPIWCSELQFITSICYNGDIVLCSADYVEQKGTVKLGNIMVNSLGEIAVNKARILKDKLKFNICEDCRMPRAETCHYVWDDFLSPEEKELYKY